MKVCSKKPVIKRSGTKRASTKRSSTKRAGTRRRRSGCRVRCMKPGPIVRNPYLNFLRKFRKENCGLTPVETIRRGARAWKSLTVSEKLSYIKEAFYAPKRRRNMQCHLVCKKKPTCGKGQRKRGKRKRIGHGRRRSRKPKATHSKPRKSRSKARHSSSKPKPSPSKARSSRSKSKTKTHHSPSKTRRRSSKSSPKKAGFT
ncbi:hypothetical protein DOY81_011913, partial [Sarcophaga bullata]